MQPPTLAILQFGPSWSGVAPVVAAKGGVEVSFLGFAQKANP